VLDGLQLLLISDQRTARLLSFSQQIAAIGSETFRFGLGQPVFASAAQQYINTGIEHLFGDAGFQVAIGDMSSHAGGSSVCDGGGDDNAEAAAVRLKTLRQ